MANDRIYLVCACGAFKMLLKYFPGDGATPRDNGVLDWAGEHSFCNPNFGGMDLKGDPGFHLVCESSNEYDALDQSKFGVPAPHERP